MTIESPPIHAHAVNSGPCGLLSGLSVRGRLTAAMLGFALLTMAASVGFWIVSRAVLDQILSSSETALQSTRAVGDLTQALSDEETGLRGYVLTANPTFLDPYTSGYSDELTVDGQLAAILIRPDTAAAFRQVQAAVTAWRSAYAAPTISAVASGDLTAARSEASLNQGKTLFDDVRTQLTGLQTALGQPDADLVARINMTSDLRTAALIVLNLVILLLVFVASRALSRWVGDPIERLVATAHRVEAGADVPFVAERRDEVGDLGAALERMRLRMRQAQIAAESRDVQSTVLNRFTELIGFLKTDGEVAEAVLSALQELVQPADGIVHISNASRDRATPEAIRGGAIATTLSLNALAECPGIRRGSIYMTSDVAAQLSVRCPVYPAASGSVACIPLTALGANVGAAHLHWDRVDALSLDAASVVTRIAEHSALSIANRRLVATLQGMANTDPRTGLSNTRAFDEAVEDNLVARHADPSSLLMLDLDHFKAFNDRHGHPAGDEALRTFAGLLVASVRDGDLVARYGGEEFAVLLPGLGRSGAMVIAERIRARAESTIVALGPGITGRLSVSIGVAVAPDDALDRVGLLRAADAALYRAKSLGRNRVACASDRPDPEPVLQAS